MTCLRVLLDTNILIGLEDPHRRVSEQLARLTQMGIRGGCSFLVHPASLEDLARDRDLERRAVVASKVGKYPLLDSPPVPDPEFLAAIGTHEGPTVDSFLLYAVLRNCVHALVTEDKGIRRKARRLGLESRVYSISECLDAFEGWFGSPAPPPNVQDVPLYSLDARDPIFDSVRVDYPEFDQWFAEVSRVGRRAWVVGEEKAPEGVCIYKEEHRVEGFPQRDVLKLCTFKVREDARGAKVGELLLKTAFRFGVERSLGGVYVTVFPRHGALIGFYREFGFDDLGKTSKGEYLLYKPLVPGPPGQMDPLRYHIRFYPHFLKEPPVRKFLVPVRPEYHRLLFPEARLQPEFWPPRLPASNAIRKAYISRSTIKKISPGDILVFYLSGGEGWLTTIAVVERVVVASSAEELLFVAGKRTVYPVEEIRNVYPDGGLVIFFREAKVLRPFAKLATLGLPPPQSIREIRSELLDKLV